MTLRKMSVKTLAEELISVGRAFEYFWWRTDLPFNVRYGELWEEQEKKRNQIIRELNRRFREAKKK